MRQMLRFILQIPYFTEAFGKPKLSGNGNQASFASIEDNDIVCAVPYIHNFHILIVYLSYLTDEIRP